MVRGLLLVTAVAGCHVVTRIDSTHPGKSERVRRGDAIPGPPTITLSKAGALRFVEPLECPTVEVVVEASATELRSEPNIATFVVGMIATAIGGVVTARGALDGKASTSPYLYAGIALDAIGLPLAVGPWLGNHSEERTGVATAPLERPGPNEACGERPLVARAATVRVRDLEVFGTIDADGVFAVSPYQLVDAFAVDPHLAWQLTATVDGGRTISVVLEPAELASRAMAFLARADFDTAIAPLQIIPGVTAGTLRASLTTTATGPALRVVLPLGNDGPGDAYALRGQVTAPGLPAIDGRLIYVGHLASGATATRELLIPLSAAAEASLRDTSIDLSVELRDAHGTAPTTPIRFRGALLGDAPR